MTTYKTPEHDSPSKFVSVTQVATALRLSRMTIYRLIHDGKLPAVRIGRSFRVHEDVVAKFLNEHQA